MLERMTYQNHLNEIVEIGSGGIFANENDLRDFAWSVTTKNGRITSVRKGIVKKTIPLIIFCSSESAGIKTRNHIFEVMEKDVLSMKHGKLMVGDYYLKCFVTGSKKSEYLQSRRMLKTVLTVETDFPTWIKETTTVFNTNLKNTNPYLDYPYDMPYDFMNELSIGNINNMGFVPAEFRIVIYGHVNNPTLYISGKEYTVNTEVGTGEYLTIDSMNKTIFLTKFNGQQKNCFNARGRESYIFEKIPEGSSVVATSTDFSFDITLLEERSEPKWI